MDVSAAALLGTDHGCRPDTAFRCAADADGAYGAWFELCAPDAAFSLATEVLQHLNLCFADELSLTELTNRFHVSTSHMIHMFKAQFGLPPIQYMVRRRIGEAQHLLRTTEDSAGDIGGRVGMINRNYFYRMFKRLVGVSPVRYREVIGERPDMLA